MGPISLTFGFVAAASARETLSSVSALASFFAANHDLDLQSRPSRTYEELATSVREGRSDVAWLPPVAFAWLAERVTAIGSIVRGGRTSYSAALVAREESAFRARSDLAEARVGWVDAWSAAGYVVPRLELGRAPSGLVTPPSFRSETFYGSHREALLALERGDCDVVGTYARTPAPGEPASEGAWSELGLRVVVLETFGEIPPDVLAVRRNLGRQEHEAVSTAFRAAFSVPHGRALVRAVFGGDELREGLEPGHETLRRAYERGVAHGLFDRDA